MTIQYARLTLTLIDGSIDFLRGVYSNLHKFVNQDTESDMTT